jgi:hypothetical protein
MKTFEIGNRYSGVILGVYAGQDQFAAIDAMARDAGYTDYKTLCAVVPSVFDEIYVVEVTA